MKKYLLTVYIYFIIINVFSQYKPGNCVYFYSSYKAVIPYTPNLNLKSFTYEMWISPKLNYGTAFGTYNNDYRGIRFSIMPSRTWSFQYGKGTSYNKLYGHNVIVDRWVHLVATRDSITGYVKFYMDGVLMDSSNYVFVPNDYQHLAIGGDMYYNIDAQIDEVRIWNYPRSQTEILSSMNDTVAKNSQGLIAYYRFDDDSTSVIRDIAGTYNATISDYMDTISSWQESFALLRPLNVDTLSLSFNSVELKWDSPDFGPEPTSYYVDIDDDIDFSDPQINNLHVGLDTSLFISCLSAGTEYYARVRAFKDVSSGQSQASALQKFKTTSIEKPGNACLLDGINDYISMPNISPSSDISEFTVEGWINPKIINDTMLIYCHGDNGLFQIYILPDSSLKFSVHLNDFNAYEINSVNKIMPNTWQHFAATWKKNYEINIYINGVYEASLAVPDNLLRDPSNAYYTGIGAYREYATKKWFYNGKIDEFRIWKKQKTEIEIKNLIKDTVEINSTNLLLYYRFDQANTSLINDHSDFGQFWDERKGLMNNMDTINSWVESFAILKPINIEFSSVSSSNVNILWQQPTFGPTPVSYRIDLSTDSIFNNIISPYSNFDVGNVLTYNIDNLNPATIYFVRIRAYKDNISGLSYSSDVYSFITDDTLTVNIADVKNADCNNASNGYIVLEPQNGTPPYTFQWSNGQSDSIASNLQVGNYSATISDITGDNEIVNINIISLNIEFVFEDTLIICSGDSIFLQGQYQFFSGLYIDSLLNQNGCDSIIKTVLNIENFNNIDIGDTIIWCYGDNEINLHISNTWPNILWSNGSTDTIITLDTTNLQLGENIIYINVNNGVCFDSDSVLIISYICDNIIEESENIEFIIKNNLQGKLEIYLEKITNGLYFNLFDSSGRTIWNQFIDNNFNEKVISISNLKTGIYYISVIYNNKASYKKVLVK